MPPRMMTIRWFAKHYGYTEEQTLSLSVEALEWLPIIELASAQAEEQELKAQQRVAHAQAGRR